VLFSATSFSDFLDRFSTLQNIVGQDKEILEQNKQDRDEVATKKQLVEDQLEQVKDLATQAEEVKDKLSNQEKQKEGLIASLDQKVQEADDIGEEADKAIVALAAQRAELNKKKKELENSFKYSGGKLLWPLPGETTISDVFGYRINPVTHQKELHKGVDI